MKEGFWWLLQLVTGLLMAIALTVHMALMHWDMILGWLGYSVGDVLSYSSVMARAASVSWAVFYILLLALVIYHGFYGLRAVLLEWFPTAAVSKGITTIVVTLGSLAFAWGIWVTLKSLGS